MTYVQTKRFVGHTHALTSVFFNSGDKLLARDYLFPYLKALCTVLPDWQNFESKKKKKTVPQRR